MKNNQVFADITKNASKTFYNSSLLFPKNIRDDVFILYSFVRIADDLIDSKPPKIKEFEEYRQQITDNYKGKTVSNLFVNAFGDLAKRKKIPFKLVQDFFEAQSRDAKTKNYKTYDDLLHFIYGVAEVIGLLMAHVMDLPKESHECARKLGRAMQLINIMRDIDEDRLLGKVYLPQDELKFFDLPAIITPEIVRLQPRAFSSLITFQSGRILDILDQSQEGFRFIPKNLLLPIKISADLYRQTIQKIAADPKVIFQKKVKPSKYRIVKTIIKNLWK